MLVEAGLPLDPLSERQNLHLKHGKRFFNSSAPAQARPGRKFGIESAVDFERVTRSSR